MPIDEDGGRRPNRPAAGRCAAAGRGIGVVCALAPSPRAQASDLLGLYVGGAIGESRVSADGGSFNPTSFDSNHTAFKAMVGIRPIPLVGAELEYVGLGRPTGTLGGYSANVDLKGAAGFAMLYLPVPVVDVFLKLGLARLQSTVNSTSAPQPACGPCQPSLFSLERTDTHAAEGVGVQYKFGSFAARGEYERFDAAGSNPNLWSVGLTYSF